MPRWSPVETAIFVSLNAFGCATIVGETIPIIMPKTAAWSITKYFAALGALFAVIFALQYVGVRMVIESHAG